MQDVEYMITDEMIDAGCAAVPDLYRVDVWRVLRAAMTVKMIDEGERLVQVGPCTCSDHECGECMQLAPKVGAGRTAADGRCTLGDDRCNCGGDTPGVRATCQNWKPHNAKSEGAEPLLAKLPLD